MVDHIMSYLGWVAVAWYLGFLFGYWARGKDDARKQKRES